MPRKWRNAKARRDDGIRPSVLHFLSTGDLAEAERDNPWLTISLTGQQGRAARDAWQRGDEREARAQLELCVAAHNFFVKGR